VNQFVNAHYTHLLSSSVIVRLRTSQRRNDCQETIPIREIDHQYHISTLYVDALASHTVLRFALYPHLSAQSYRPITLSFKILAPKPSGKSSVLFEPPVHLDLTRHRRTVT
jgi:hypothetical protein